MTRVVSGKPLRLLAAGTTASNRSYHWNRQSKIESTHEHDGAVEKYSKKVADIEDWFAIWTRVDGDESTKVRKIIESKVLQLGNHRGIFAGSKGLSLLQRLLSVEYNNRLKVFFGFDKDPIARIVNDALAAKIREESSEHQSHFHIDSYVINGKIKHADKGSREGFTLASRNMEEYFDVCAGKKLEPGSPLFSLKFEEVESISWPATHLSHLIVNLEMRNGDDVKFFAYHSQGAEELAWELKRLCKL